MGVIGFINDLGGYKTLGRWRVLGGEYGVLLGVYIHTHFEDVLVVKYQFLGSLS